MITHFTDCTYDFATAINSKTYACRMCSTTAIVTFFNSCFRKGTLAIAMSQVTAYSVAKILQNPCNTV